MSETGLRGKPGPKGKLADPTFLKLVATCFANGMSRGAMCDELGVSDLNTITKWRQDPRVKAIVKRLLEDRVIQVSRRIDSIIEGRLTQAETMDTNTLLRIRKEYGGAAVARTEKADDATVQEAMNAIEEDPDLPEKLARLLSGASV